MDEKRFSQESHFGSLFFLQLLILIWIINVMQNAKPEQRYTNGSIAFWVKNVLNFAGSYIFLIRSGQENKKFILKFSLNDSKMSNFHTKLEYKIQTLQFLYASRPIKSLNTTTSTPYAHIRSEDFSNLVPKVAEC